MVNYTNHPNSSFKYGELDCRIFNRIKNLGYVPQVVFDVGASNGAWSRTIASVLPHAEYHLFEPLIDFSSEYQSVISKTLSQFPNFHLHEYAVGEFSENIEMSVFEGNLVGSTALDMKQSGVAVTSVPARMITLDHAIEVLKLPQPQVIKIDTQGCELSVLKGNQKNLSHVGVLLLECWLYRGYGQATPLLTEISDWLLQFGFRLWDVGDEYRNDKDILTTLDCVFVNQNIGIAESWYY
jgi:FkbM family methyltransferase